MPFNFRKLFSKTDAASDAAGSLPDSIDIRMVDGVTIATFREPASVEDAKSAIRYIGDKGIYHRRVWDVSNVEFPYSFDGLDNVAAWAKRIEAHSSLRTQSVSVHYARSRHTGMVTTLRRRVCSEVSTRRCGGLRKTIDGFESGEKRRCGPAKLSACDD